MGHIEREKRRRANKRRNRIIGGVLFFILFVVIFLVMQKNKEIILEKNIYTNSYNTNFFLFKDIGYVKLQDFSIEDLTIEEGQKSNGYLKLTKEPMALDQNFVSEQIGTIDQTINEKYFENWPAIIDEIKTNYVGMAKVKTQFGQEERDRKLFLVNSVQFMGSDEKSLKEKKKIYEDMQGDKTRNITLSDLHLPASGYVFSTLNNMEKVVSQSALPFINTSFLENASKIERQDETALKVVNNDHIFAAFAMPAEGVISGESEMKKLKDNHLKDYEIANRSDYYRFLVRRVDFLREYPTVNFSTDHYEYSAYFVDVLEDEKNKNEKIIVLLIKDYVNVFAKEIMIEPDIYLEQEDAYILPQSCIEKKEDKTYVQVLEKGTFPESYEVDVKTTSKGKAILSLESELNRKLSPGMVIKVYP